MPARALCIVLLAGLPAALAGQPVFRGTDILPMRQVFETLASEPAAPGSHVESPACGLGG